MVSEGKPHIVIFVEGDTDKVFFDSLLNYYRAHSITPINSCEIFNLRGVSRYTSKVVGKLENSICPNARKKGMFVKAVCCSYDTDIFEFSEKPAVDWKKVKAEVKRIGISQFCEIRVERMMEDWLLDDTDGLCSYLKIDMPNNIPGKNGLEKMQSLFRKARKVYMKGNFVLAFIRMINMEVVRKKRAGSLNKLEELLNVKLK